MVCQGEAMGLRIGMIGKSLPHMVQVVIRLCWPLETSVQKIGLLSTMEQAFFAKAGEM
jgi:hypothetical protein